MEYIPVITLLLIGAIGYKVAKISEDIEDLQHDLSELEGKLFSDKRRDV